MRIALGTFDVQKAFRTSTARLVDDDHRLLHELVLDDDALDQARHLVSTTTGARWHNKLHRLGRLPSLGGRNTHE